MHHIEERKAVRPTKGMKSNKPSQNDKEGLRKAQKHKKTHKLKNPLNQLPLTLSMQALPLR
jgi:ribosomal protein L9